MNTKAFPPFVVTVFALIFLSFGSPSAYAVSGSWIFDGSGNWSEEAKWSTDPVVPGTAPGDVINLTNDISASTTVTINTTPRTAGILNIGDADASALFVLAASGGGYLTMDNGGTQAQINLGAGGGINSSVLSAPLRLTTGGVLINNTSGNTRVISAPISTDTTGSKLITVNSSGGNIQFSGVISDGAGQIGVLWDAGGVGFFNGNNTFSGGITIQRGSLRNGHAGGAGFGTGTVTLGNASSGAVGISLSSTGTRTIANNIVVSSTAADANVQIETSLVSEVTYSGNIDIQRNVTFNSVSGAAGLIFSGDFTGSGNILLRNSGGNAGASITLSGDNSGYTGNITTDNSLRLNLGHTSALGTGTVTLTGSNLRLDATADLVLDGEAAINWNTNLTFTGSHNLNLGDGTVTLGGSRELAVEAGTLGFGGEIQDFGAGYGIVKDGAGTLLLDGANTYTGGTIINEGTLAGVGSVAGSVIIGDGASGAVLAPGSEDPGTFTIGGDLSLLSDATFAFTLNSTLGIAGKVIANGVFIDGDAVFSILDLGSQVLTEGTTFLVIENTSGFDITGAFSGLTEGSIISAGANQFQVSYFGGSGHDFVLEVVPEPSLSVVRLLAIGAGVLLQRRRRFSRRLA